MWTHNSLENNTPWANKKRGTLLTTFY